MTQARIMFGGPILSPRPNHPRLPDLASGLLFDLNAKGLGLSDGAEVSDITLPGDGPLRDRRFQYRRSGTEWPKFGADDGPGGTPALIFNGAASLANSIAGDVGSDFTAATYALVGKYDDFPATSAHSARWLTSFGPLGADPSFHLIRPSHQMPRQSGIQSSDTSVDPVAVNAQFVVHPAGRETGWFVAVVSLTPGGGIARFSGVPPVALAQGAGRYRGLMLGASTGSSNLYLQGRLARLQVFRRAFAAEDVEALHLALSREYEIAD